MTHAVNRPFGDQLPPGAMQTYRLAAPIKTHRRRATCAEVDCGAYLRGWTTSVEVDSPQALYIRRDSGRRFVESAPMPGWVTFTFEAGQTCFAAADHTISLEREPFYLIHQGDHRGFDGEARVMREGDWVDHFANHQDQIATLVERG